MKVLEGDRPYLTPMKEKLAEYPADWLWLWAHNGTYQGYNIINQMYMMLGSEHVL